jgi:hypothetical protein
LSCRELSFSFVKLASAFTDLRRLRQISAAGDTLV